MWRVNYENKGVADDFYFHRSSAREALWTIFIHDFHTEEEINEAKITLDNQHFIEGIGSYEQICVRDIDRINLDYEVRLSVRVSAPSEAEAEDFVIKNLRTIVWDNIEVEEM